MKLLILTQAVDRDDPVLGFFHAWVEEFASRCEHVTVLCLKVGRHSLPENVSVYSLGKSTLAKPPEGIGAKFLSRCKYVLIFYRSIWVLHKEYDSVFVHMNQEYVLLGWKLWWLMGKRVTLWRNHQKGTIWTHLAGKLVRTVFYTSPQAYVAGFKNAIKMPIGIDTDLFKQQGATTPRSVLFLGRLDSVKKPEIFIAALKKMYDDGISFLADMYGAPTYPNAPHVVPLVTLAAPLVVADVLRVQPSVPNEQTPAIYASHDVYVNLTPSGSFDKTIGEAMASGCIVVTVNAALRGVLPPQLLPEESVPAVADSIAWALSRSSDERAAITQASREYVVHEHALPLLVSKVLAAIQA